MPVLASLSKKRVLSKMKAQVKAKQNHKTEAYVFNFWMSAMFHKKVQMQILSFKENKLKSRLLRVLKERVQFKKRISELKISAAQHNQERLINKVFKGLERFKMVKRECLELKLKRNKAASQFEARHAQTRAMRAL